MWLIAGILAESAEAQQEGPIVFGQRERRSYFALENRPPQNRKHFDIQ